MLIVEITDSKLKKVIKEYFTLDSAIFNHTQASKAIAEYLKPNWFEHCEQQTEQLMEDRAELANRIKPMVELYLRSKTQ